MFVYVILKKILLFLMKPYLDESLIKRAAEKNFAPLFDEETHQLHIQVHA